MGEIVLYGYASALFAPTVGDEFVEDMEGVEHHVPLGLLHHLALDDTVDGILGLAVELGEVPDRSVYLHVLHQDTERRFRLLHGAGVQPSVVIAEDGPQLLLYVYALFHAKKCL